eukprot:gene57627-biopygen32537
MLQAQSQPPVPAPQQAAAQPPDRGYDHNVSAADVSCMDPGVSRCGGTPRMSRMNNIGTSVNAQDCVAKCVDSPGCNYAVFRVVNNACTDFETCTSARPGNGPWVICPVRGPGPR